MRDTSSKGDHQMQTKIILIAAIILATGCASGVQQLRKVDPGMTTDQVEEAMGRRDGFSSVERDGHTFTLYQYINRFCNAHVSLYEKCDFFVIFKDGKVIETGVKDVRATSPNMQFLYIFRQP